MDLKRLPLSLYVFFLVCCMKYGNCIRRGKKKKKKKKKSNEIIVRGSVILGRSIFFFFFSLSFIYSQVQQDTLGQKKGSLQH